LAFVPLVSMSVIPRESAHAQQRDPFVRRADALLSVMTTEQKVGQLFMVAFPGPRLSPTLKRMIAEYHIGGIVLFSSAGNLLNTRQTVKLINDAQAEAESSGARIPLFVAVDEEGGRVSRLPPAATWFPSQMALGAIGPADEAGAMARAMARTTAAELKALGINMNLAPVLDVNDNPANPVIGTRSFGSRPEQVARLGAAMITEYKAQRVLATAKHFPGHGNTDLDSHRALPVVTRTVDAFEATDLLPFKAAVRAGADAIMTAHVVHSILDPFFPATLSHVVLNQVLRKKLGFNGLIVSDSLLMRALTDQASLNEATVRAFQAGVDVLAIGADAGYTRLDQRSVHQAVVDAVNATPALRRRLDDSVRRILAAKGRYGILDRQPVDAGQAALTLGSDAHRAVAGRIARGSVTLVRDWQRRLPLQPDARVLVVLPEGAADLAAPLRACHAAVTVAHMRLDPSASEARALTRRAERHDAVIVATLNAARNPGQSQVVTALLARSLIVVALQDPYDLNAFPQVPTFLTAYGDVPASLQAIADVLCGRAAAKGRLPVALGLP
jgi:beta-N-acetylhexosaminidase